MKEENPGKVLPNITIDRHWNMVQIREEWSDQNDMVIGILTELSGATTAAFPM